jgi:hypothetical protein|tara:strand:- start:90 stop:416 length:327 start_codon:yes stop_codon:yes gene_type:complete
MVKRVGKNDDGMYHIKGDKFPVLVGSRAQVMHKTAYKTTGGLTKKNLKKNKHGKIVSRAKSAKGPQMLKRLTDKGYFTRKGKFGAIKKKKRGKTAKKKRGKTAKKKKR